MMPDITETLLLGRELAHPKTGILRGLYASDGDSKLVRIKISELRKIRRFVDQACLTIASVDTHPQGGDGEAAPFMSGAVSSEETTDAQTNSESSS